MGHHAPCSRELSLRWDTDRGTSLRVSEGLKRSKSHSSLPGDLQRAPGEPQFCCPGSWELLMGELREEKRGGRCTRCGVEMVPGLSSGGQTLGTSQKEKKTRDQHNTLTSHFCRVGRYKKKRGKSKGRAPSTLPRPLSRKDTVSKERTRLQIG